MSNEKLTFQELKDRISIIDVATYLGYQYDKSKGIKQPSFVLLGADGSIEDRIYIKNPTTPSIQGFWRRTGIHNTGDVISFVKEHLDKFKTTGRNELDILNKVLHRFAGKDFEFKELKEYKRYQQNAQVFDPNRWEQTLNPIVRDRILSSRNLSQNTFITFAKHIDIVQDKEQGGKYSYIGFPYSIPGENSKVGYELRGVNGFKSKASGTNSTEAMWLATFTDTPEDIKNIYIAESAFDALAFYQIYKERINLQASAFVSFGGSFSDKQFLKLREQFPTARPVLLFDKDLNGHMYDIRAMALMSGHPLQAKIDDEKVHFHINNKSFSINQKDLSSDRFASLSGLSIPNHELLVYKPKGDIKDWNEVLLQPPSVTPTKYEAKR